VPDADDPREDHEQSNLSDLVDEDDGTSSSPTWRSAMAEMVDALLVVVALVAAFIGVAALLRRLLP
jgi:hypothetical protein